jgi:hypothetical protein
MAFNQRQSEKKLPTFEPDTSQSVLDRSDDGRAAYQTNQKEQQFKIVAQNGIYFYVPSS